MGLEELGSYLLDYFQNLGLKYLDLSVATIVAMCSWALSVISNLFSIISIKLYIFLIYKQISFHIKKIIIYA